MKGKIFIGLVLLMSSCLLNDDAITIQEQLKKDVRKIDQFLEDNNVTGVIKDASGVRFVITQLGDEGLPPTYGNNLKIHYTGTLLDGTVFDSGTLNDKKLNNFILGWQIILPMLPEGTSAIMYIPSVYAYGAQGSSTVPANANLVFDITIESVTPTAQQVTQLEEDGEAIDNYLAQNAITAVTHESGLRYQIITQGTGPTPSMYDQIKVKFTGNFIPTGLEFTRDEEKPRSDFSSRLCNYLHGWQIGLPLIQKGGKIKLFIPSGLAFGTQASQTIPANSNLIYEIELLDVIE